MCVGTHAHAMLLGYVCLCVFLCAECYWESLLLVWGNKVVLQKVHGAALYFATGHCIHNSPRTPENPALHMQAAALSLAVAASEFDGQL